MRTAHKAISLAGVTLAAATLAACAGGTVTSTGSAVAGPVTTVPAEASHPASPPAKPATSHNTGIGTAYLATGLDGTSTYWVDLTAVDNQVSNTGQQQPPPAGEHYAGTVFKVTGNAGSASSDALNDAAVIGSNDQVYQPAMFATVPGFTGFNDGVFNVTSGESETGAVAFTLPDGVSISKVQWSADPLTPVLSWTVTRA